MEALKNLQFKDVTIVLLFLALVAYNILDVYQTKLLFDVGAIEANPLLSYLIDVTGTWISIIITKVFFLFILGLGLYLNFRNGK